MGKEQLDSQTRTVSSPTSRDRPDSGSAPDLHEEFVRVLEKAVKDLDWSSPEEPAKSKLDSWYFQAGRHPGGEAVVCPSVGTGPCCYARHVHPRDWS